MTNPFADGSFSADPTPPQTPQFQPQQAQQPPQQAADQPRFGGLLGVAGGAATPPPPPPVPGKEPAPAAMTPPPPPPVPGGILGVAGGQTAPTQQQAPAIVQPTGGDPFAAERAKANEGRTLIGTIGDPVAPREGLLAEERVEVARRQEVVLPSGRTTADIPGLPEYPMPASDRFDPPRDGYGRYRLPNPHTGTVQAHTRATTMAGALKEVGSLGDWKDRQLLKGLIAHPELVEGLEADLFGTNREYVLNRTLKEVAEAARTAAGANDKREFGTAVHAWTEAVDAGEITFDQVPDMFKRHVAVYTTALWDGQIEVLPEYIERIVYCPLTDTIGTVDRIFRLSDGTLLIGDIKTSSNISFAYPEIAAQLAQYAHASHMLAADGSEWLPMPEVSKTQAIVAAVPGLPNDRDIHCDLVQINLSTGRALIDLAVAVREARRESKRAVPMAQLTYKRSSDDAMAMMYERDQHLANTARRGGMGANDGLASATSTTTTQLVHDVVVGELSDDTVIDGKTVRQIKAEIDAASSPEQIGALWTPNWPEQLVAYGMRRSGALHK